MSAQVLHISNMYAEGSKDHDTILFRKRHKGESWKDYRFRIQDHCIEDRGQGEKIFHLTNDWVLSWKGWGGKERWEEKGEVWIPVCKGITRISVNAEQNFTSEIKMLNLNENPVMDVKGIEKLSGLKNFEEFQWEIQKNMDREKTFQLSTIKGGNGEKTFYLTKAYTLSLKESIGHVKWNNEGQVTLPSSSFEKIVKIVVGADQELAAEFKWLDLQMHPVKTIEGAEKLKGLDNYALIKKRK